MAGPSLPGKDGAFRWAGSLALGADLKVAKGQGSWEDTHTLDFTNYLIFIIRAPLSLIALLPSTGTGRKARYISPFREENFRCSPGLLRIQVPGPLNANAGKRPEEISALDESLSLGKVAVTGKVPSSASLITSGGEVPPI